VIQSRELFITLHDDTLPLPLTPCDLDTPAEQVLTPPRQQHAAPGELDRAYRTSSSLQSTLIEDEEERDGGSSTDLRDSLSGETRDQTSLVDKRQLEKTSRPSSRTFLEDLTNWDSEQTAGDPLYLTDLDVTSPEDRDDGLGSQDTCQRERYASLFALSLVQH
jgi:hypothetical protein